MAKVSAPTQWENPGPLIRFERTILKGAEWHLTTSDWVVLQLSAGIAYAFDIKGSQDLPLGGVIICPPQSQITLTASVLGNAVFRGVAIRVNSLMGFLTVLERQCLEAEVAQEYKPFLALPAGHPVAMRLTQLFAQEAVLALSSRLAFAQTFAELVGPRLNEALNKGRENEKNQQEARGRLRQLIRQTSEAELANLSLGELAKMLHCCERHASRLFRLEYGTGFPSYISHLRLNKACELLRQKNLKIIDVALESGHGSLTHFNFVFKKRFHMTPTEWRECRTSPPRRPSRARPLQMAAALVWLLLSIVGVCNSSAEPATGKGSTNPAVAAAASAKAVLKFKVDRYEVTGNTVLSSNLISRILAPYTGDAVDISTVTNAMSVLQLEYYQRGYVTVKVTAPPQQVTNRAILFQVTEGRLAAIKILHNHFFTSNAIMRALPYVKSLESGERVLNSKVFQTELDRANSNPDRQISPEVRPGLEPGTTALILDIKDRMPLHGRVDLDNYSPPGTPELRVNANISYDNLWQLDHSIGLQYGFSPDEMKPSLGEGTHLSLNQIDAPQVTYYSGYYRAPLGAPVAAEEQIAPDQTRFGYNETTKQFVTPPTTGRPEFIAYASRSTTGPTLYGPETPVVGGASGTNNLLTIDQQLISQQYTSQTTAGGRFSFPLPTWQGIQSSWSAGMDYKEDKVVTLPTNYFYYTVTVTHGTGGGAPTTTQSSIAIPGVATYPSLSYAPLFLGWTGSREDHWGQFGPVGELSSRLNGNLSLVAGTGGIFFREKEFPTLIANSSEATTEFVAIRPQVSRIQVLPANFTLFGSLSGQWANEPLLNLEQLALGGNGTVRGYREGELYADTGWVGQLELRSPIYWRGASALKIGTQITLFTDYGEGYLLDQSTMQNTYQALWGAGVGLNFHIGSHVESHVLVGWPLSNSSFSTAGHERISFSVSAQL